MGGMTITIQKDRLLEAFEELKKQQEEIENEYHLHLDGVTLLTRDEKGEYWTIGDKGRELSFGTLYPTEKFEKNIILFAHFGK